MSQEEIDEIEKLFQEEERKPSLFASLKTAVREWWERVQERRVYSGWSLSEKWLLIKQFTALLLALFYCYITLELYKRSSVYLIVFAPTIYILFDYIRLARERGG